MESRANLSAQPIYLDNNATTPTLPEVVEYVAIQMREAFGNPGSAHSFGRVARRLLEDSRERIAGILSADASEVIFTSGGTESINMAVQGLTLGRSGTIALTEGEHPATVQACARACQHGMSLVSLPVDAQGRLVEQYFDELPWKELRLVCVILAHNETGVIQNLTRLSTMCHSRGVPLLVDAVQAAGKIPVSFRDLGAAALAFGAHKFHGPRGVGGLLLKRGVRMPPFLEGGHQESGRRAGTEPVPLIAGMCRALELFQANQADRMEMMRRGRDCLESLLEATCQPLIVHGRDAERLPNTLSVAFRGVPGEPLLINLHLAELACSLGSTCSSGSVEPAPALLAMGLAAEICRSSVRFSLGVQNTMSEIEEAGSRVAAVVSRLRMERGAL